MKRTIGKWTHKSNAPFGDRLELKQEDGSRKIISLPMTINGRGKKSRDDMLSIYEFRQKYPDYSLVFTRLSTAGRFGNTVDALDGKKIKITIEVVD